MSDIKAQVQNIDPNCRARDVRKLVGDTGSIYEALAIIGKRANQLSQDIKSELLSKLEEFATSVEAIEEVHENKEQIEISKFYEKLPNPVIIATEQFLNDEIEYRYTDRDEEEEGTFY